MESILIVTKNKEIVSNISRIKLQNHNLLILTDINYIKHYIEEYMPKYTILSADFKNYERTAEYVNYHTESELIVMDSDSEKSNITENLCLGRINNLKHLEKVLDVLDNLKPEIKDKENKCKFLNQQIISFYSVQGGVGKTSIVFNFAWYLKNIVEGKILIIDLNFCEGPSDLTINLDLNISPNLSMFIEKITQEDNCLDKSVISLDNKIDILQPPLSIYQSDKFNIDMLNSIIYSARNKYNIILSDVPFRYDNISLEMLNLSTASVLVLSPDIKLAPRIRNFQKFLPLNQEKGIIFNKVNNSDKKYMSEYKNILGIPVHGKIIFIPEENRKMIINGKDCFNILDLQSGMSNLKYFVFKDG